MYWLSLLMKKQQKIREDHSNPVNYTKSTGNTEHKFYVENFWEKVKQGLFYVYVICNRCLYYSNVIVFDTAKFDYEFIGKSNTNICSFEGKCYICRTSNTYAKSLKVPCQTAANGFL